VSGQLMVIDLSWKMLFGISSGDPSPEIGT
jgi:hypothetical protein